MVKFAGKPISHVIMYRKPFGRQIDIEAFGFSILERISSLGCELECVYDIAPQ